MQLSVINDFITGKKFSNSLHVEVSKMERRIPDRMQYIKTLVKDKRVIHFGCADHIEIIESKISKDIWLHKHIMQSAQQCIGIDNNKDAVDFLQHKLHIPDIHHLDVLKDAIPGELLKDHYDYLIMGEIIEHIDDPVMFLKTIHQAFKSIADEIVISSPNAFKWGNFRQALNHTEIINSDHRYWFTVYTLSKILHLAGFEVTSANFVESYKPGKWAVRRNVLFRLFPMFRDTVLINAKF